MHFDAINYTWYHFISYIYYILIFIHYTGKNINKNRKNQSYTLKSSIRAAASSPNYQRDLGGIATYKINWAQFCKEITCLSLKKRWKTCSISFDWIELTQPLVNWRNPHFNLFFFSFPRKANMSWKYFFTPFFTNFKVWKEIIVGSKFRSLSSSPFSNIKVNRFPIGTMGNIILDLCTHSREIPSFVASSIYLWQQLAKLWQKLLSLNLRVFYALAFISSKKICIAKWILTHPSPTTIAMMH